MPSIANKKTDILGFGEIGGVGELAYHCVKFKNYLYTDASYSSVIPFINEKNPPEINPEEEMTGEEILTSLCNLAKRINDYNEKTPFPKLIITWCTEHMHPYRIGLLNAFRISVYG